MTVFWKDLFSGSGDLTTHAPDVGGAYTSYSGGALTYFELDGVGSLLGADWFAGPKAASALALSPGPTDAYRLTAVLNFPNPIGNQLFECYGRVAGSDARVIRLRVAPALGTVQWRLYQSDSQVYFGGPLAFAISPGDTHTFTIDVDPAGVVCTLSLDGVVIDTASGSGVMPDELPDSVRFQHNGDNHPGTDANFTLDALMIATPDETLVPAVSPVSATLAQTLEAATLAAVAAVIVSATLAVTTADAFAGTGIVPPEVLRPKLLLYEPLPLRTTRDLGDFAEDAPLAYVFGDLTAARFPLRRLSATRGHAADHAMEITGAGTGTTPTNSWAASIEADRNGHVCTFVDFLSPVDAADVMWAYGRGMRNSVTGALIENPGEIMEAVSRVAYRRDLFQQAREECVGINVAGRFASGPLTATSSEISIRASIDVPAQSAGLIWCAGMARRYPAPVSGYVMALDQQQCALRADPKASVDGTADILRIAYDFCDVTGKPQKSLELTASPQRYGGVVMDLALPMLRSVANAAAVGTPILQRLACERYAVELNIGRTDVRPGQWLTLSLPTWPFSGPHPTVMVLAVSVDHADQSTAADCEWLRTTPTISVTAHSLALPDTFAGDLEIADANGIATLTVFDDAHHSLQGARVSLDGGEPKTTNDRGQVSFPYTPGHTYQITIEAPGRGTVTIFQTLG